MKLFIRFIQVTHIAVLIFATSAGFWPWPSIWILHLFFVPLMILQWQLNKNQCVLTQLEAHLKGEVEVSEGGFVRAVWERVFGHSPSEKTLQKVIYGILLVSWLNSFAHWWAQN